jgi:hypothetical protein
LKYQAQFGISRHIAASYVIARRGLGLKEALPEQFLAVLPKIAEEYEAKNTKARSEKKKVQYTDRIKTLREWKKNSPKTTKHAWKLWAVLLNYWKEHQSEARAPTQDVGMPTEGLIWLHCRAAGVTPHLCCTLGRLKTRRTETCSVIKSGLHKDCSP